MNKTRNFKVSEDHCLGSDDGIASNRTVEMTAVISF